MKSFSKFGLTNIGAFTIVVLISSKDLLPSCCHLKGCFSLIMLNMYLTFSKNLGTKFLRKLIWPKKDFRSLLLVGKVSFYMAFTLSGSILMPSWETICPKSLPSSTNNKYFFGFKDIPCCLHWLSTFSRSSKWCTLFLKYSVRSSSYITMILSLKSLKEEFIAL